MQVSHDRDFLNSVTTDIIHLHDNMLHQYRGNFAQFEEMYEQKRREVNKVTAITRNGFNSITGPPRMRAALAYMSQSCLRSVFVYRSYVRITGRSTGTEY